MFGIIVAVKPGYPSSGKTTYSFQYDSDDLVVTPLNCNTIKSISCFDCCDQMKADGIWKEVETVNDSEELFDDSVAAIAGSVSDKLALAAKDILVTVSCLVTGTGSVNASMYLQIADDDAGVNLRRIDRDFHLNMSGSGEVTAALQVSGIVPKGRFWRVACSLATEPEQDNWIKNTFSRTIMGAF